MPDDEVKYACDLTWVMRTRLFCGMYNSRSIPPRLRIVARIYCFFFAVGAVAYVYFNRHRWTPSLWSYWLSRLGQFLLAFFVSMWTEDEYIFKFFTRNKLTDVTLDSPPVFSDLLRQIKYVYRGNFIFFFVLLNVIILLWYVNPRTSSLAGFLLGYVIDFLMSTTHSSKMMIMALFNGRIRILRRRLERYGFRTIGQAPPQPYCQIYDEIWKDLEETNIPLKIILFFDLIFNCGILISYACNLVLSSILEISFRIVLILTFYLISTIQLLVYSFGHVVLLESAAAHCDGMAVFTATQLIKTPTKDERARMHLFLDMLLSRGARYYVLRALPLDARLVLSIIGFCSAQVVVMFNTFLFHQ